MYKCFQNHPRNNNFKNIAPYKYIRKPNKRFQKINTKTFKILDNLLNFSYKFKSSIKS